MSKMLCVDCGTYFESTEESCPKCGCPKSACIPQSEPSNVVSTPANSSNPQRETNNVVSAPADSSNRDWGHYIYECGVLFWDTFNNRFFCFTGRASRRELWSFVIMFFFVVPALAAPFYLPLLLAPFYLIAGLFPFIGVWVRRMHDVNKSGWWSLCPVVVTLLALKRSDKGVNNYGSPMDYTQILS